MFRAEAATQARAAVLSPGLRLTGSVSNQLARICGAEPRLIGAVIRVAAAALPHLLSEGLEAFLHALPLAQFAPPAGLMTDLAYMVTCRLPAAATPAGFVEATVVAPFPRACMPD
jgi:hypothetical protein